MKHIKGFFVGLGWTLFVALCSLPVLLLFWQCVKYLAAQP